MNGTREETGWRRLMALPVHHIDVSVLREVVLGGYKAQVCERYLAKVGVKYKGLVSVLNLGRTVCQVLQQDNTGSLFEVLAQTMIESKIKTLCPDFDDYALAIRICQIEPKIAAVDALDLAIAHTRGAHTYVTLNRALLRHKGLERELNLKIMSPQQL